MTTPIILDCDPGHDDVFAIWLAAGDPAIELRAITTVGGNGRLEHTTLNARIACTVAGIEGVPIAAGVLYPFFGWLLSPIIAGAAMSLSSVSVITNALRLRRVRL